MRETRVTSLGWREAFWLVGLSAFMAACGDDGMAPARIDAALDAMDARADGNDGTIDGDVTPTPADRFQRGVAIPDAPAIPDVLVPIFEDRPDIMAGPTEIELTGRLYFNDLRNHGRFDLRQDPEGSVGAEVGTSTGSRPADAAGRWLPGSKSAASPPSGPKSIQWPL